MSNLTRRAFLKNIGIGGLGMAATATVAKPTFSQSGESTNKIFLPTIMNSVQAPSEQYMHIGLEEGAPAALNQDLTKVAADVLNSVKYTIATAAAEPYATYNAGTIQADFQQSMALFDTDVFATVNASATAMVNTDAKTRSATFGRYGVLEPDVVREVGLDGINTLVPSAVPDGSLLDIQPHEMVDIGGNVVFPERLTNVWGPLYSSDPAGNHSDIQTDTVRTDKLAFYITRIKCVDETDPHWGRDEIALAGINIDENGDTKRSSEHFVGKFNGGNQRSYTPHKRFTWFNMQEQHGYRGAQWPKRYTVVPILAEKDNGGLASFLHKLWGHVQGEVKKSIAKAVGAALSPYVGKAIGAAIGQIAAWAVNKLVGWLINLFKDDIFWPVSLACNISSYSGRFTVNGKWGSTSSPLRRIHFKGYGGHYYMEYYWQLFA